jgi:hypothetical protein
MIGGFYSDSHMTTELECDWWASFSFQNMEYDWWVPQSFVPDKQNKGYD